MLNLEALARTIKTADNAPLIGEIQKRRDDRPLVTIVLNKYCNYFLNPGLIRPLFEILEGVGKGKVLDLFLQSTGGIAEIPWHIVSLLRSYTKDLAVIIPEHAYSGATHIAISADELVMLEISSLGCVDPSKSHPLLPKDENGKPIQASVQDFNHIITFITSRSNPKTKSKNLIAIIPELFKYVNPLALGAIDQANQLSRLITTKVLGTRNKKLTKKHISKIVNQLAGAYFSHTFPISRDEVETDLQLKVTRPSNDLKKAIWNLNLYYDNLFKTQQIVTSPQFPPIAIRYLGFIESEKFRHIIFGFFEQTGNTIGEVIV
jgi:hypothetical protein